MNDLFHCIEHSHTTRNFLNRPIPDEELQEILQAALWAPSAGNLEDWFLYVVTNQDLKQQLAKVCHEQPQVGEAAAVVVVLANTARANDKYQERGAQLFCIQDAACATQNMILAAEALGLGSCWVGAFDEQAVQVLVEAAPHFRAVSLLCLGYAEKIKTAPKNRRKIETAVKYLH